MQNSGETPETRADRAFHPGWALRTRLAEIHPGGNTMTTISNSSRISVPSDTLINILGVESVLLSLKSQQYFGLDEVGTRMWGALTSSPSVATAYDTLLEEYDAEPEALKRDLFGLIGKLAAQGLIEVQSE